jgi:hypothetical protein
VEYRKNLTDEELRDESGTWKEEHQKKIGLNDKGMERVNSNGPITVLKMLHEEHEDAM